LENRVKENFRLWGVPTEWRRNVNALRNAKEDCGSGYNRPKWPKISRKKLLYKIVLQNGLYNSSIKYIPIEDILCKIKYLLIWYQNNCKYIIFIKQYVY